MFDSNCLTAVREIIIKDCSKLSTIAMDSTSVIGDDADEQKWSPKPPFYYKNKMTLLS